MADLDSFTTREEDDRKAREEAERRGREEAARRAREEAERREKADAERREKEEARAQKEEAKLRKKEDEEKLARQQAWEEQRLKLEEEKRAKEADERERKAKKEEVLAAQSQRQQVVVGEDTDQVRKRMMMGKRGAAAPAGVVDTPSRRRRSGWGKPVAITLFVLLAAAVGAAHFMPISSADYERAASEALGKPVKVGEMNFSLVTGLALKLKDVRIGDNLRIASVTAVPEFGALSGERKAFTRIELDNVKLTQEAAGDVLFARVKADNFSVERVVVHKLELVGAVPLPQPF